MEMNTYTYTHTHTADWGGKWLQSQLKVSLRLTESTKQGKSNKGKAKKGGKNFQGRLPPKNLPGHKAQFNFIVSILTQNNPTILPSFKVY